MENQDKIRDIVSSVFDLHREVEYKSENEIPDCSEDVLATLTLAAEIEALRQDMKKFGPSQNTESQ